MKKHTITGEIRETTGKRVKNLRNAGKLPATVYGKNFKSLSVTVDTAAFTGLFASAGESGLIELTIGQTTHPVLVGALQVHPVTGVPLHVEFRKVDLKEKIKANVAIRVTGVSPAVTSGDGLLLVNMQEVEVEALPADLPDAIEVDVSGLTTVDSEYRVKDLRVPKGVTLTDDPEQSVVRVTPPAKVEEVQPAPAPESGEETPGDAEPPKEGADKPAGEDKTASESE